MAITENWPRGLTRQVGLIGMPEPREEAASQEEQENTEGAGGGAPRARMPRVVDAMQEHCLFLESAEHCVSKL